METIKDCKHKDCIYNTGTCDYSLVTGHRRGCKISECDKYTPGCSRRKRPVALEEEGEC